MTVGVNDYPWRNLACCCSGLTCCCSAGNGPPGSGKCGDSWGCTVRQCTSFCRWRMANDLGVDPGGCFGNGGQWANWFMAHGYTVNRTPAVGAILCLPNISSAGHVAFVYAVPTPTTAVCEQYNFGFDCSYSHRTYTVATSGAWETWFIHLGGVIGNPCTGVTCPSCQRCSAGTCVSACLPGTTCIQGLCQPFPTPPPSSPVVPLVVAGAVGALGFVLYRQRNPGELLRGLPGSGFGAAPRARPRRSARGGAAPHGGFS